MSELLVFLKGYAYLVGWFKLIWAPLLGAGRWMCRHKAVLTCLLGKKECYTTFDAADKIFLGREYVLKNLRERLLRTNAVLVRGAGGIGKTELVKQFAKQNQADFTGGCFQIDMHGAEQWDEVFEELIQRSSSEGISAYEYLGVGKDIKEGIGDVPLSVRVRNALLRTAKQKGRVLLWMDVGNI